MMCGQNNKVSFFLYRKLVSIFLLFVFTLSTLLSPARLYAQSAPTYLNLPAPGTMIQPTAAFTAPYLSGLQLVKDNPYQFNFIINTGTQNVQGEALRSESSKLINYFLAALTVPEDELWVNLSPDEKDRIIADGLGNTEMGRDMLAQDYILKQLAASLLYPEGEIGQKFWEHRIGDSALSSQALSAMLNRIWIVPDEAVVYVHGDSVFVMESKLKVLMEDEITVGARHAVPVQEHAVPVQDYAEPVQDHAVPVQGQDDMTKSIIRETIIPVIEREVNEGEHFAQLRQIYHAMILATWYKNNLRNSVLTESFIDQNKTDGIDIEDKDIKNKIYNQYIDAFKKGVYDFIREDYDPATQSMIPRKYFSGGFDFASLDDKASDVAAISPQWLMKEMDFEHAEVGIQINPIDAADFSQDQIKDPRAKAQIYLGDYINTGIRDRETLSLLLHRQFEQEESYQDILAALDAYIEAVNANPFAIDFEKMKQLFPNFKEKETSYKNMHDMLAFGKPQGLTWVNMVILLGISHQEFRGVPSRRLVHLASLVDRLEVSEEREKFSNMLDTLPAKLEDAQTLDEKILALLSFKPLDEFSWRETARLLAVKNNKLAFFEGNVKSSGYLDTFDYLGEPFTRKNPRTGKESIRYRAGEMYYSSFFRIIMRNANEYYFDQLKKGERANLFDLAVEMLKQARLSKFPNHGREADRLGLSMNRFIEYLPVIVVKLYLPLVEEWNQEIDQREKSLEAIDAAGISRIDKPSKIKSESSERGKRTKPEILLEMKKRKFMVDVGNDYDSISDLVENQGVAMISFKNEHIKRTIKIVRELKQRYPNIIISVYGLHLMADSVGDLIKAGTDVILIRQQDNGREVLSTIASLKKENIDQFVFARELRPGQFEGKKGDYETQASMYVSEGADILVIEESSDLEKLAKALPVVQGVISDNPSLIVGVSVNPTTTTLIDDILDEKPYFVIVNPAIYESAMEIEADAATLDVPKVAELFGIEEKWVDYALSAENGLIIHRLMTAVNRQRAQSRKPYLSSQQVVDQLAEHKLLSSIVDSWTLEQSALVSDQAELTREQLREYAVKFLEKEIVFEVEVERRSVELGDVLPVEKAHTLVTDLLLTQFPELPREQAQRVSFFMKGSPFRMDDDGTSLMLRYQVKFGLYPHDREVDAAQLNSETRRRLEIFFDVNEINLRKISLSLGHKSPTAIASGIDTNSRLNRIFSEVWEKEMAGLIDKINDQITRWPGKPEQSYLEDVVTYFRQIVLWGSTQNTDIKFHIWLMIDLFEKGLRDLDAENMTDILKYQPGTLVQKLAVFKSIVHGRNGFSHLDKNRNELNRISSNLNSDVRQFMLDILGSVNKKLFKLRNSEQRQASRADSAQLSTPERIRQVRTIGDFNTDYSAARKNETGHQIIHINYDRMEKVYSAVEEIKKANPKALVSLRYLDGNIGTIGRLIAVGVDIFVIPVGAKADGIDKAKQIAAELDKNVAVLREVSTKNIRPAVIKSLARRYMFNFDGVLISLEYKSSNAKYAAVLRALLEVRNEIKIKSLIGVIKESAGELSEFGISEDDFDFIMANPDEAENDAAEVTDAASFTEEEIGQMSDAFDDRAFLRALVEGSQSPLNDKERFWLKYSLGVDVDELEDQEIVELSGQTLGDGESTIADIKELNRIKKNTLRKLSVIYKTPLWDAERGEIMSLEDAQFSTEEPLSSFDIYLNSRGINALNEAGILMVKDLLRFNDKQLRRMLYTELQVGKFTMDFILNLSELLRKKFPDVGSQPINEFSLLTDYYELSSYLSKLLGSNQIKMAGQFSRVSKHGFAEMMGGKSNGEREKMIQLQQKVREDLDYSEELNELPWAEVQEKVQRFREENYYGVLDLPRYSNMSLNDSFYKFMVEFVFEEMVKLSDVNQPLSVEVVSQAIIKSLEKIYPSRGVATKYKPHITTQLRVLAAVAMIKRKEHLNEPLTDKNFVSTFVSWVGEISSLEEGAAKARYELLESYAVEREGILWKGKRKPTLTLEDVIQSDAAELDQLQKDSVGEDGTYTFNMLQQILEQKEEIKGTGSLPEIMLMRLLDQFEFDGMNTGIISQRDQPLMVMEDGVITSINNPRKFQTFWNGDQLIVQIQDGVLAFRVVYLKSQEEMNEYRRGYLIFLENEQTKSEGGRRYLHMEAINAGEFRKALEKIEGDSAELEPESIDRAGFSEKGKIIHQWLMDHPEQSDKGIPDIEIFRYRKPSLDDLKVVYRIGPAIIHRLRELGILSVDQLAALPYDLLLENLSVRGTSFDSVRRMHDLAKMASALYQRQELSFELFKEISGFENLELPQGVTLDNLYSLPTPLKDSMNWDQGTDSKFYQLVDNLRALSQKLKINIQTDSAELNPGGIDFNPNQMNLQESGDQFDFEWLNLPSADDAQILNIQGVVPVIIDIKPVTNFPMLLGLNDHDVQELTKLMR